MQTVGCTKEQNSIFFIPNWSSSVELGITGYHDLGRRRHAGIQDTNQSCRGHCHCHFLLLYVITIHRRNRQKDRCHSIMLTWTCCAENSVLFLFCIDIIYLTFVLQWRVLCHCFVWLFAYCDRLWHVLGWHVYGHYVSDPLTILFWFMYIPKTSHLSPRMDI